MNPILIIGARGQDGRLLTRSMGRDGISVVGVGRGDVDLRDRADVLRLLAEHQPSQVYYLAAHHHSADDQPGAVGELFARSIEVNVHGLVSALEAIRAALPRTRLFYCASSHIFGRPGEALLTEATQVNPTCIYGITKAAGLHTCRFYRETHGVFAAVGILFNHESPLRSANAVSQKIVRAVAAIRSGRQDRLVLGDLSARVDWGYAPDYVEAMRRILSLDAPDDFVVATGDTHSIQEFVEIAFGEAGLDWRRYVSESPGILIKQKRTLVGDASKLRAAANWTTTVSFEDMVKEMLHAQLDASQDTDLRSDVQRGR